MKRNQFVRKIGIIVTIVCIISLLLSLFSFIGLGMVSDKVEEVVGYRPTADELKDIIEKAKSSAEYFELELQDIADFLGISATELTFIQLFLALRIPCLAIGILALVIGIALMLLTKNPAMAGKIGAIVSHSATTVSGAVTTTVDNATVKCERCGEILDAGTKFCTSCGNKLETIPAAYTMKKCLACQSPVADNSKFCTTCGAAIRDESMTSSVSEKTLTGGGIHNAPENAAAKAAPASKQPGAFHRSADLD